MPFRDRADAGVQLAERVAALALADPVVLALPRGGVPVAAEVAARLGAPLDVVVARKVGAPGREEFGIGAVAEGGAVVEDGASLRALGISPARFDELAAVATDELARRVERYRGSRPLPDVAGRDVVVVDDGLATGVTAEAALVALARLGPRRTVLAVPVCAPDTADRLLGDGADDVVCVLAPADFRAVGLWYDDFSQTSDDEVLEVLAGRAREVAIPAGGGRDVIADVAVPAGATAVVVFAHGSGSSRRSGRNRAVAEHLRRLGLATVLVDLLADDDDGGADRRFDIDLLADRVDAAVSWLSTRRDLAGLAVGLFGASTGAAAALVVAARRPAAIGAVVSRGGRPDLAAGHLASVRAPTLLVVGGADEAVLDRNRQATSALGAAPHRLDVVPGATHLFEEPGALEQVAALAGDWFAAHLAPHPA